MDRVGAPDQLVEKGERRHIRLAVRVYPHNRLTERARQAALFLPRERAEWTE